MSFLLLTPIISAGIFCLGYYSGKCSHKQSEFYNPIIPEWNDEFCLLNDNLCYTSDLLTDIRKGFVFKNHVVSNEKAKIQLTNRDQLLKDIQTNQHKLKKIEKDIHTDNIYTNDFNLFQIEFHNRLKKIYEVNHDDDEFT